MKYAVVLKQIMVVDIMNCFLSPPRDGISIYRGVIVCWDSDYDSRVLKLVDMILDSGNPELVAISEHEGGVAFVWKENVPGGYSKDGFVEVMSDSWNIYESVVLREV